MNALLFRLLSALLRLLSRLPLRVLYFLSDVLLYPLLYYVVRYRRRLVRRQLLESFPDHNRTWLLRTERRFYHFLCDYVVETLKMLTISNHELMRRVSFPNINEMQDTLDSHHKPFGFFYLGHLGNWEWLASFPLRLHNGWHGSQVYHPLRNPHADQFFIALRQRFGSRCVPMRQTLRHILRARAEGRREIVGFIADQSPKWEAMHFWTDFLHHPTSFFTGTERIAREVDAALYYIRVTRPRRGYYEAQLIPISLQPDSLEPDEATRQYVTLLEEDIRRAPELWLWTHNRWKRTYQEWIKRGNSPS